MCMCAYAHTQTMHVGYWEVSLEIETRHLEGPKKSRWTQIESLHICIRICVQSTHLYTYAGRQDYIWNNCFFSLIMIFLPKKESNRFEQNTKNSNSNGFKLCT